MEDPISETAEGEHDYQDGEDAQQLYKIKLHFCLECLPEMNVPGNEAILAEAAKWASDLVTNEHKPQSFLFSTGMILVVVLVLLIIAVIAVWWMFIRKKAPEPAPVPESRPRPTKARPSSRHRGDDEDEEIEYVDAKGRPIPASVVRSRSK